MDKILYQYTLNLTTWIYLSSLLAIAIYFKFNRVWSVRNLDLLALVAMSPGLLLVVEQQGALALVGYVWLFVAGGVFLVRLLIDPMMVRRPLLEPNLSTGGLTFIAVSLLCFLMVNVITRNPSEADLDGARRLDEILSRKATPADETSLAMHGPGYPWLHWLPSISSKALVKHDDALPEEVRRRMVQIAAAQTTAILSHLAVVIGIVLIGAWHFDNIRTGIAAATLYLLLPYTAAMTGHPNHVLPAALIVWAVVAYRLPLVAGMLIGLATGVIYYPLFLLPLWLGFYWQRGLLRFSVGVSSMVALLVASLAFTSSDLPSFLAQVRKMFGWTEMGLAGSDGIWAVNNAGPYRIPVLVAFVVMSASFALWPARKNLGTLLSCSAAVMLGTQFWLPQGGGTYMAWYLPLLLLTVFRPNLEDRVALSALGDGWFTRRRWQPRIRAA